MKKFLALFVAATGTAAFAQQIDHVGTFGPSSGSNVTVDVTMNLSGGDDWNASTITIETFGGATIISPNDNTFGTWAPPFPDLGTAVDTYLRSPSAPPLFLPQLVAPSYTATLASATWLDPAGTTSPASFLGARVGLSLGAIDPSLVNLSGVGNLIANINIASVTRLGGGNQLIEDIGVYDGVPEPSTLALLALGGLAGLIRRR